MTLSLKLGGDRLGRIPAAVTYHGTMPIASCEHCNLSTYLLHMCPESNFFPTRDKAVRFAWVFYFHKNCRGYTLQRNSIPIHTHTEPLARFPGTARNSDECFARVSPTGVLSTWLPPFTALL
jgi:hypothetical protein